MFAKMTNFFKGVDKKVAALSFSAASALAVSPSFAGVRKVWGAIRSI